MGDPGPEEVSSGNAMRHRCFLLWWASQGLEVTRYDSQELGYVDVTQENGESGDLQRSPLDGQGQVRGEHEEGGFGKLEPFLRALGLKAKWGAFWGLLKLFWPVGSLPFWSLVRGFVEALFGLCCSSLKPVKGG